MIEFKNINLRFNDKIIFEDFNLKIDKNEKVIFNSPSGKGKSILLKMLLGFVRPDSGEIFIDGKKLDKQTIKELRKKIAYVSQGVELKKISVKQFFDEIFELKNNKHQNISLKMIKETLINLRLNDKIIYKNIKDISGGEKQRVALTAMLLLDKEILILDEVTSALEKDLKKKIVDYILNLEKTVLAISHDEEWLEQESKIRIVSW